MMSRETAIARVRALPSATPAASSRATALLERANRHLAQWTTDDARQRARIATLRDEIHAISMAVDDAFWSAPLPWQRLLDLTSDRSFECQELIAALILEPHGELVDDLETSTAAPHAPKLDPAMTLAELSRHLRGTFAFALDIDFASREATDQFWYVSEEKLEPRLGRRYDEPGADLEMPLDIARQVQSLQRDLQTSPAEQSVAEFLLSHPAHRNAVIRVQTVARNPYSEIRDNLIGAHLPADRHAALQARLLRRRQVRPALRPLDAHHDVPGRAVVRRTRCSRNRRRLVVARPRDSIMSYSLNELESLLRKAAAGSGFPAGHADAIAAAGIWLARRRFPACQVVERALTGGFRPPNPAEADNKTWFHDASAAIDGLAAIDLLLAQSQSEPEPVILEALNVPTLLLGLCGDAADQHRSAFTLARANTTITVAPDADLKPEHWPFGANGDLCILRTSPAPAITAPHLATRYHPIDNAAALAWDALMQLAHNTYVPASEHSRLAGAGAGLTDND